MTDWTLCGTDAGKPGEGDAPYVTSPGLCRWTNPIITLMANVITARQRIVAEAVGKCATSEKPDLVRGVGGAVTRGRGSATRGVRPGWRSSGCGA